MADEASREDVILDTAAQRIGITVAHVRELVDNGWLAHRTENGELLLAAADVEAFRLRRERQKQAIEQISGAVNQSPEGWDS